MSYDLGGIARIMVATLPALSPAGLLTEAKPTKHSGNRGQVQHVLPRAVARGVLRTASTIAGAVIRAEREHDPAAPRLRIL
jgi:hypothetical protein